MVDSQFGTWTNFAHRADMVAALSAIIADDSRATCAQQANYLLGVSGGSTPIPVYERLASMDLPWSALQALIVDERRVAADHPHSNEAMVRRCLLGDHPDAVCVGLRSNAANLTEAAQLADARVRRLNRPMDAVLLGMGEDGHFASCFLGADEYAAAISADEARCVVPITPLPEGVQPAVERLTLTWAYIRRTRRIMLAITGATKREVLQRAQTERDTDQLPIATLFQDTAPPIHVFWSP